MDEDQLNSKAATGRPLLLPHQAKLAAILVTAVIFAADLLTPSNLVLSPFYAIPVALCSFTVSISFLWTLTAIACAFTFAAYFLAGPAVPVAADRFVLANRGMAAGLLVFLAGLEHLWLTSQKSVKAERGSLEKKNSELEELNLELGQREEEIVRQNEELQSQTEELERQTEELRMVNEELAAREKVLEQLLELSRSITADLCRSDILKKICDTLEVITSYPSAVLEKREDAMVIVCSAGFGHGGPQPKEIPFSQSFGSLILSMGQTGYLEDIRLRPNLVVPRPSQGGEIFLSVLSSPLKLNGRSIGTVEIYSPKPQSWSDGQVSMIESLAAQASYSLQSVELVEQIRDERSRFEVAFRTMPFGIAIAEDPHGKKVRLNPAGSALLNLAVSENIAFGTPTGDRLMKNISRDGLPVRQDDQPLSKALRGEEVVGEELEVALPHRPSMALLISASPFYDSKGSVAGAIIGFADITEQKKLLRELDLRRREAEEASLRKTRFLAAVSHDIRTPANAIHLITEVIRRIFSNPTLASGLPDLIEKLQTSVKALMELVGDLLDVARFDTGHVQLEETEFSLNELIAMECRNLEPLADHKGLSLAFKPQDPEIRLRSDRVKLARVIGNLVGNAIKFTEKGSVRVTAALTPDPARRVVIRIADTGVGIPADQFDRIFDEFAQLRNPARDRGKGTGLGLAICRRLVALMGGAIDIESMPGEGTTFTVSFPASVISHRWVAGGDRLEPIDLSESGAGPLDLDILLVEDHLFTREGIRHILEEEGARITEAVDGSAALRLLGEDHFDVVLLDMMLPDIDGRDVLKSVRWDRLKKLKAVLVLTADLTPERAEEVRSLGGHSLIAKPVDLTDLLDRLRRLSRKG